MYVLVFSKPTSATLMQAAISVRPVLRSLAWMHAKSFLSDVLMCAPSREILIGSLLLSYKKQVY